MLRGEGGRPCPPTFPGSHQFLRLLDIMGIDATNGMIVNLGATLLHLGPSGLVVNRRSAQDEAWQLFLRHPTLHLRMVAYEGNTSAYLATRAYLEHFELEDQHAKRRLQLVNEFVASTTLPGDLRSRGVPHAPLLLKVDIDSIDLPVLDAVLDHFRPHLIWAEVNYAIQLPIFFAALEARASQPGPRPTYGKGLLWRFAHCAGASLAAFERLALRHSFAVVQTDSKNVLLVRSEHSSILNASNSVRCHAHRMAVRQAEIDRHLSNRSALVAALRAREAVIRGICARAHTPFNLSWTLDEERQESLQSTRVP